MVMCERQTWSSNELHKQHSRLTHIFAITLSAIIIFIKLMNNENGALELLPAFDVT